MYNSSSYKTHFELPFTKVIVPRLNRTYFCSISAYLYHYLLKDDVHPLINFNINRFILDINV